MNTIEVSQQFYPLSTMEVEDKYPNCASTVKHRNESVRQKQKDGSESLPWVEKYRPSDLDDVISQNDIITTSKCLANRVILPSKALHRNK